MDFLRVPGAPTLGVPGVFVTGTVSLGTFVGTPVGGATAAALRLGPENASITHSASSGATQTLGLQSGALGAGLHRAITFPANYANIPASTGTSAGDHWLMLWFRTGATPFDGGRNEYLLSMQGFVKGAVGGGEIFWNTTANLTGATGAGVTTSATAGLVSIERRTTASTASAIFLPAGTQTAIQLVSDAEYCVFFGYKNVSGSDYGNIIVVNVATGVAQSLISTTPVTVRPTSLPLFDQIGCLGSASSSVDGFGFSGHVGEFAVVTGQFPSNANAVSIAQGGIAITSAALTSLIGATETIAYYNTLDYGSISAGAIAPTIGTGNATIVGSNVVGAAPIRKPSNITLKALGPYYVFPLAIGATSAKVWFEGTGPVGAKIQCQLLYTDASTSAVTTVTVGAGGTYVASVTSPWKKPFYRQVSPVNGDALNTIVDRSIMDVGVVIPIMGQSECNLLFDYSGTVIALGTGAGYTSDGVIHAIGTTSIPLITGTGTILTGNWVQFAGDANTYQVTTGIAAPGAIVIAAPGLLQQLPATAQAVTILSLATDSAATSTGHTKGLPGSLTGPWASWIDFTDRSTAGTQQRRTVGYGARPEPMLGAGVPGDAIVQACGDFITLAGVSTMVIPLTASGHSMDSFLFDQLALTLSPTLAGAGTVGTPYTTTLALTQAAISSIFSSNIALDLTLSNQVKPSSVTITFPNAGSPVVVTDVFTGYTNASTCTGTFTGPNGAAGTINYMTGVISLSFTTPLATTAGYTASWKFQQEIVDGSTAAKTANINGATVRTWVDAVAGIGLRYGATFGMLFWVSSNETDTTQTGTPNQTQNLSAKYNLVRQMYFGGGVWAGYQIAGLDAGVAAPPFILIPKSKDAGTGWGKAQNFNSNDVNRAAQSSFWPGAANAISWALPSAWYLDQATETTNAHPDHSDQGGRRQGRRLAKDWYATWISDRTQNRGPEWGTPTWNGTNVWTVPLSYIGSGLQLAVSAGGNASALDEWYVGGLPATSTVTPGTNGTLVDNGVAVLTGYTVSAAAASSGVTTLPLIFPAGTATTIYDGAKFSIAGDVTTYTVSVGGGLTAAGNITFTPALVTSIAANAKPAISVWNQATAALAGGNLTVTITKTVGNWTGSELIRYVMGAPSYPNVLTPCPSLLYDNRGGFGGFEAGLPAAPKLS